MPAPRTNPPLFRRIVAFMVDLSIVNIFLFSGFRGVLGKLIPTGDGVMGTYHAFLQDEGLVSAMSILTVLMSLFLISYFVLSEYLAGTTIGMAIMRLSVQRDDKKKPSLFQALIRNLYCFPFFPFIVLWLLEPVYLFMKGQRMTEHLTRTKTIME